MNVVLTIDGDQLQVLIRMLDSENLVPNQNAHSTIFRTDGAVITVYNSGKVLIQGKQQKIWEDKIVDSLGLKQDSNKPKSSEGQDLGDVLLNLPYPHIGSDESGKGDFFGPLVTAAFLLQSKDVQHTLTGLGVTDSKKLSDKKILELGPQIKKLGPHHIVKIGPAKYNDLYARMKNINSILGWSHARAIENILLNYDCSLAVADQFGAQSVIEGTLFAQGRKIKLIQSHRAERDVAVAAASILARYTFINAIHSLRGEMGQIPLGAGENAVIAGVQIAKENGVDSLKEVAKLHFKTYDLIKSRL